MKLGGLIFFLKKKQVNFELLEVQSYTFDPAGLYKTEIVTPYSLQYWIVAFLF